MKKMLFIAFLMMSFINVYSQDYFINFAAIGDTTSLNTVKVVNLKTFDTVTINSNDVLHLVYWPVGIKNHSNKDNQMTIYPNPMTDMGSTVKFNSSVSGNTTINIFDMLGKVLYKRDMNTLSGENTFMISGLSYGSYILKISGTNYSYTSKLLSVGYHDGVRVDYVSNTPTTNHLTNHLKSTSNEVEMTYTTGNILQYKGISGKYSSYIMDIPTGSKTVTFHIYKCVDADGRSYSTIRGKKLVPAGLHGKSATTDTIVWMAENLNVGTQVTMGHGQSNNDTIEKHCYDDDTTNCTTYGGLYQWDEMMKYTTMNGTQGICPDGWHIPTNSEFMNYILNYTGGGMPYGGSNMKEVGSAHWMYPWDEGTDSLGYTALPNGMADYLYAHAYINLHIQANWWTSTEYNATEADWVQIQAPSFSAGNVEKAWGMGVRCVHN